MGAWQRVGRGRGEGGHSVPRTAAAFGCRRAVGLLVLRAPSPTRQVVKLPTHHSAKHPLIKPSSNCPNGGDTCFLGGGGVGGTTWGAGSHSGWEQKGIMASPHCPAVRFLHLESRPLWMAPGGPCPSPYWGAPVPTPTGPAPYTPQPRSAVCADVTEESG